MSRITVPPPSGLKPTYGQSASGTTEGNASASNDLVINEIHADPASENNCEDFGEPPDCGDANNDGTRHFDDDEFVEIINAGPEPINIGGYSISDDVSERFTFPEGTILPPNVATVVFGGGDPTEVPGLVFIAGTLSLNNDGDTVTLMDDEGNPVTAVTYGAEGGNDQSVTRNPDIEGPFALHTEASSTGELYSPGRTLDGGELPVELSAFEAVRDGRDVVLQWTTASETNNSGFTVQQHVNGAFQDVGFVEGAGTVATPQDYTYRVSDLASGTHTFRLKQIDVDGMTTLSKEVEMTVSLEEPFTLETAYPNPFCSEATFTLRVQETQEVTVTLFNALGQRVQEVFAGTVRADAPEAFTIDGERLPSGVYLYRVDGRTFSISKQIARIK